MKILFITIFLLFNNLNIGCLGCILCHKYTPKPPVPLDEFRLPSIEFLLSTKDQVIEYCDNTSVFNLTDNCGKQIKKLFCAVKDLWSYVTNECPQNEDECKKCQIEKAKKYMESSWFLAWFDSIGKMPSGISDGNYHWLGDYEQCALLSEGNFFESRYCMVKFELKGDIKQFDEECQVSTHFEAPNINLGICTPAYCTPEESKTVLRSLAPMPIEINCEPPAQLSTKSFIFIFILGMWIIFVLTMSILEHSGIDEILNLKYITNAVSIRKNFRQCFSTKRPYEKMHTLDGIQFLSALILVIGNVFNIMAPYMENVGFLYFFNKRIASQPIINYLYHVDGLLVLSALATTLRLYVHVNSIKNTIQLILDRAIRIFPIYAFILCFTTFLFARLGNGPMWSHSVMADRCEKEFWKELLFINNFFGYQETCLDGSYVIANAAQLFIVLMILLYINKNFPKASIYSASFLIIASIVYTFTTTVIYKTPPALIPTHPFVGKIATEDYINKIVVQPYSHIGPYFVGFLFALFIVNESFPKIVDILLYIGVLIITVLVIYTPYLFIVFGIDTHWNILFAIYSTFSNLLWSSVLLILIYLLDKKTNLISVFLSWRIFHPLSKLSYVIFLISEPVALYYFSSLHRPFHATTMAYLSVTMGIVVVSIVLSALVDVFVSRPIRNIFKFSERRKYLTESNSHISQEGNSKYGIEMSLYKRNRKPSDLQKKGNKKLNIKESDKIKHQKGCPDYESDVDDISIIEHEH
uniref:NRF domain-containing protein n=1 Tax=Strongyloides papillosus TaxID=174720 RepID=A0A0N5CEI0_STREA